MKTLFGLMTGKRIRFTSRRNRITADVEAEEWHRMLKIERTAEAGGDILTEAITRSRSFP